VLRQERTIGLTEQEQAIFVRALLHPPAPGPRLRSAAKRYRKVMGR
jgi:uncharacterized protein (DUF1778 family)